MFVITSVAMLRERTSGTLELLLTKPLSKGELLTGYAFAFGAAAVVQVAAAAAITLGPLGLDVHGSAVCSWLWPSSTPCWARRWVSS
jgi:ABC-2 type transport system permease protein